MHTVGPGVWKDNGPIQKMSKSPGRTWNMTRNTEKREKKRNVHCRTWKMARKLKNVKNEKHTL